jgi:hypothetical protein
MPAPTELIRAAVPAEVVAERYAAVTGFIDILPSFYADPSSVSTSFVGTGRDADRATLVTVEEATEDVAQGTIGNYNPADNRWRFFPEYVRPDEAPALRRLYAEYLGPMIREYALAEADEGKRPFADVHHPATRLVRRNLKRQLSGLPIAELLARPAALEKIQPVAPDGTAGARQIGIDEGTIIIPTLNPGGPMHMEMEQVSPYEAVPVGYGANLTRASYMTLLCMGVIVENPKHPGHTMRTMRQLVLARRDPGGSTLWHPDTDIVGDTEWTDALRPAIGIIAAAANDYKDFSPMLCAITRNAFDAF